MNTIQKLISEAKTQLQIESDYGLAKRLKWSRQAVSNYQRGERQPDVDACFDIAELLGRDPAAVIAAVEVDKATAPEARAAWIQRLKQLGGVAAMWVFFVVSSASPAPAEASSAATQHSGISQPNIQTLLFSEVVKQASVSPHACGSASQFWKAGAPSPIFFLERVHRERPFRRPVCTASRTDSMPRHTVSTPWQARHARGRQ